MLKKDGWVLKNAEGSHFHFVHPTKPGKVTIPGPDGREITPGTLRSILKQAGLR